MDSILVVEEAPVAAALEQLLVHGGERSVYTAANGAAALEILGTHPVHLVISSQSIPGTNGISLLSRIAQLFPDIPRLLLTEDEALTPERAEEILGEPIPVITKPWDDERLCETVTETLNLREMSLEETLFQRYAGVTAKTIERARRIQSRLEKGRKLGEVLVDQGAMSQEDYDRARRVLHTRMSIVEILQDQGMLGEDQLHYYEEARQIAPDLDQRELLVEAGLVSDEHYLQAICLKHDIPYQEPDVSSVDPNMLEKTSFRYMQRYCMLPVSLDDDGLNVILGDPLDTQLIAELERNFGVPIKRRGCTPSKITDALNTLTTMDDQNADGSAALQYREIEQVGDVEEIGEEAVKIVDYLLVRAVQLGASDLHIEPLQNQIRVRVRVDGVLQQLTNLPNTFAARIVSRLKILGRADIAEKRTHQDGKICIKIAGREIDIRVSIYVTVFGETVVMRLLDRNKGIVPLDKIGFAPRVYSALTEVVLESSSGLVLLVGPTGSGKTTTLYSFIDHANDPTEKVITCEDPVEYVMDGVVQCNVNSKTGPTFADSLRAIVRQDPDSIVVGEIRDKITASLALESALTGHKVFSTFHTEEAVGAFVRLLEMGMEPFLVASTLSAVIAQRLIRRLCDCKQPGAPTRAEMRFLGLERSELQGTRFFVPGECGECNGSGYKGRLAIHEVLIPDDALRDMVLETASSKQLREQSRQLPEFLTMQEDGLLKASLGLTSLAEIIANAPRDTSPRPLATLTSIAKLRRNP